MVGVRETDRRQGAEGRRQKAEGRRQKAERKAYFYKAILVAESGKDCACDLVLEVCFTGFDKV
jgi:hypothetical protein